MKDKCKLIACGDSLVERDVDGKPVCPRCRQPLKRMPNYTPNRWMHKRLDVPDQKR